MKWEKKRIFFLLARSHQVTPGHRWCPPPCLNCFYIHQQSDHSRHLPTSVTKVVVWFSLLRLFLPSSLNKHGASATAVKSPGVHRRPLTVGSVRGRSDLLLPRLALDGCHVLWRRGGQAQVAAKLVSPDAGLYTAEGRDWWGGTPLLVYTGVPGFTYHGSVWVPGCWPGESPSASGHPLGTWCD